MLRVVAVNEIGLSQPSSNHLVKTEFSTEGEEINGDNPGTTPVAVEFEEGENENVLLSIKIIQKVIFINQTKIGNVHTLPLPIFV